MFNSKKPSVQPEMDELAFQRNEVMKEVKKGGELSLEKRGLPFLPRVLYIDPFPMIKILNVQENRLQEINVGLVRGLPQLVSLDACNNLIHTISPALGDWAETLVQLRLGDN